MKKQFLGLSLFLCSASAAADFIGVHGEIGVWNGKFEGKVAGIEDKNKREANNQILPSFEERGLEEEAHTTFWVAFEHPIPMLPNVRLSYLDASASGWSLENISTDKISFVYNGVPLEYDGSQPLYTTMDFSAIDGTAYWEILDNWLSLDVGLTIRVMDGEFVEFIEETPLPIQAFGGADGCGGLEPTPVNTGFATVPGCLRPETTSITPIDIILPMIFAKAQFDLPFSGLYGAVTAQGITFDGSTMLDAEAKLGYMFDLPLIEIGAALGYRYAMLKADDLDSLYADASLSGTQFSLNIHF